MPVFIDSTEDKAAKKKESGKGAEKHAATETKVAVDVYYRGAAGNIQDTRKVTGDEAVKVVREALKSPEEFEWPQMNDIKHGDPVHINAPDGPVKRDYMNKSSSFVPKYDTQSPAQADYVVIPREPGEVYKAPPSATVRSRVMGTEVVDTITTAQVPSAPQQGVKPALAPKK